MIRIAVCDDETAFLQEMCHILTDYTENNHVECQICPFSSGEEMLQLGARIADFDIAFLDINMDGANGMEVARTIREYSGDTCIVFVTAYFEYAIEGYAVDAVRYIIKEPNSLRQTMEECMRIILTRLRMRPPKKRFQFVSGEQSVKIENIIYIESKLHRTLFYLKVDGLEERYLYKTLNEVEKELAEYDFVRIHQSYLVNMKYIRRINHNSVDLNTGKNLPMPRSRAQKVRMAYSEYLGV